MEPVMIGQAQSKMTSDIPKEEQVRVLLRVNWTAKSEDVPFNPDEDLKGAILKLAHQFQNLIDILTTKINKL